MSYTLIQLYHLHHYKKTLSNKKSKYYYYSDHSARQYISIANIGQVRIRHSFCVLVPEAREQIYLFLLSGLLSSRRQEFKLGNFYLGDIGIVGHFTNIHAAAYCAHERCAAFKRGGMHSAHILVA